MSSEPLKLVEPNGNIELRGTEVTQKPTPTPEELNERTARLGDELRALIVDIKRLPKVALEPHQDPSRSLALSQSYLQTGFMWLRKAISPTKDF